MGVLRHSLDLVLLRDIGLHQYVIDAVSLHVVDALFQRLVHHLVGLCGVFGSPEVIDGYVCALGREAHGDGLADARSAACDQYFLACQTFHTFSHFLGGA
jgi:hypothetical protein